MLPIILQKDGTTRQVGIAGKEVSVTAGETTGSQVAYEDWTDESVSFPLKEGKKYALNAWSPSGWRVLSERTGDGTPMQFKGLSSNGLYWLVEVDGDHEERPFAIEDGAIVHW